MYSGTGIMVAACAKLPIPEPYTLISMPGANDTCPLAALLKPPIAHRGWGPANGTVIVVLHVAPFAPANEKPKTTPTGPLDTLRFRRL